ncbi:MAG: hypothetical protein NTY53_18905 [Kiritimatiellaeota bacterium]|nr:hypothetical protein [Kiritimatiellota bacterium]
MIPDWQRLENNAKPIIFSIPEDTIPVYLFLADRLKITPDISQDHVFQFLFRSFYGMENAGLTPDFKKRYFEIMQENRSKLPNIEKICNELKHYTNLKGQETIQFSFVTKLANALYENSPIYDAQVAILFHFSPPSNHDTRLEKYMEYYERIKLDYEQAKAEGALKSCLAEFDTRFGNLTIPELRKFDFICWAAGKHEIFKKKGGTIVFEVDAANIFQNESIENKLIPPDLNTGFEQRSLTRVRDNQAAAEMHTCGDLLTEIVTCVDQHGGTTKSKKLPNGRYQATASWKK